MGNWKKILTSNIVRAKDLVSNNIDPEGGTILRSMNGDLEWVNQDYFGNATSVGIGGNVGTEDQFFSSSVNPYGNVINTDVIDPTFAYPGQEDAYTLKTVNGHVLSSEFGLEGDSNYANWNFSLPQVNFGNNVSPGLFTGLGSGPVDPDAGFWGTWDALHAPDADGDLLHNKISLKRSGVWDPVANGLYSNDGGATWDRYTGARTIGFLNTEEHNPETNSLVTITSHKRLMSVSYQGSFSAQFVQLPNNYIEDYCRIWALPYVIPCVTPLCPIGGAPNMWNKEGFEKGGTTGVPLYSLVNAAGEEAIFYPDGLDFMPYDVSHDDDPSVSGGWTYFEILNRGLTLDQTFPRLDQGPCDINIYKEGLNFEILCPEGYFRNIYLIMGVRILPLTVYQQAGGAFTRNWWRLNAACNVTEEVLPQGSIVTSANTSGNFGDNTYNSENL